MKKAPAASAAATAGNFSARRAYSFAGAWYKAASTAVRGFSLKQRSVVRTRTMSHSLRSSRRRRGKPKQADAGVPSK
jgi:hypothetical protein